MTALDAYDRGLDVGYARGQRDGTPALLERIRLLTLQRNRAYKRTAVQKRRAETWRRRALSK